MKSYVCAFLLLLSSLTAWAQVTQQWVARYPGFGNAVAFDTSTGNIYVTNPTAAYDSSGTQLWVASDGGNAIAIDSTTGNLYVTGGNQTIGYDSSGNHLWVASNADVLTTAIAVDSNTGSVYVTGSSQGMGTGLDYATVAYDSNGNQLWVARYDGPASGDDSATGIAVDSTSGNVYVTGSSMGNGTGFDYATVAYCSAGNQLWVARYNGPANAEDRAYAIAFDPGTGNIYVTGGSRGLIEVHDFDFATVAYDSDGNQLWVARQNVRSHDSFPNAIAIDRTRGNVYVTGHSLNGAFPDQGHGTVAYDSLGSPLWAHFTFVGAYFGSFTARAIAVDNQSGNVYVTGTSSPGIPRIFRYDTEAYDSSGNSLWRILYQGPGDVSQGRGIAVDESTGDVYVTGANSGDVATIKYSQP